MEVFNISKDEAINYLKSENVYDLLIEGKSSEIDPEWEDLARLHKLVKDRKPFKTLEFGSGFSTIIIASALKDNWEDYQKTISKKKDSEIINKWDKPIIISVESSKKWQENTQKKINELDLDGFSDIVYSTVKIDEIQGQICHMYDELPDIVPDFVYLDGPDPATVEGDMNGISFNNSRRTVMSGDIIKYESTLLPGFCMVVDGRSNNARFLERMLQRNYEVKYYENADVSFFELNESRLGKKNIYGWEAYTDKSINFAGEKIQ